MRDRQDADDELKNLSANDLEWRGIVGITYLERLVYELKYFLETGQRLDTSNTTICSGLRDVDGDVPYVHWNGGKLEIYWCNPDDRDNDLRSRAIFTA